MGDVRMRIRTQPTCFLRSIQYSGRLRLCSMASFNSSSASWRISAVMTQSAGRGRQKPHRNFWTAPCQWSQTSSVGRFPLPKLSRSPVRNPAILAVSFLLVFPLFQSMLPVARSFFAVHDSDNYDPVRLFDIDDSIGKNGGEMAAGWRVKNAEEVRLSADSFD